MAVTLPQGRSTVDVVQPEQGTHYFYSGNSDSRDATLTSPEVTVPADNPTLTARVSYSIENDWDYAFTKVSTDGGATWSYVRSNLSTTTDPNQQNKGYGITGCSGTRDAEGVCDNAWADLSVDLSQYVGQKVLMQFEMFNDAGYHELGFSLDSVSLGGTLLTDVEDGAPGWTLDKFRVMDGSSYTTSYDQYYLAENRQYQGYDKTLAEGPYSFDYSVSAPDKVDHFPYQDGLLVWYATSLYGDNNTSGHVGGSDLPVDANPKYTLWTQNGKPAAYASGRLETYDSTFDVDQTDGLHLKSENYGGVSYDVDAHPSVPVFEDSNPDAYMDYAWARSAWYSTPVAGVGTEVQVLSSDESTGKMVLKVGKRFVAATSAARIQGKSVPGNTLTAVAPTWFQDGVQISYQWLTNGRPIAGATGATYKVTPGVNKVSVQITGAKDGYGSTTATASL